MRTVAIVILMLSGLYSASSAVQAQTSDSCKQCSEQRKRCMSNYPGKTCTTEYDICKKHCGKK